jgi:hypothetical protein
MSKSQLALLLKEAKAFLNLSSGKSNVGRGGPDSEEQDYDLPPEIWLDILDFVPPSQHTYLPLRLVNHRLKNVMDTRVLELNEVLVDLPAPVVTEQDRIALFHDQEKERLHFLEYEDTIVEKYIDEFSTAALEQAFADLKRFTREKNPLNVYKRHLALKEINRRIIELEIERQRDALQDPFGFYPTLDLSDCFLTRFPTSVLIDPKLKAIWHAVERLILAQNQITYIPQAITHLTNLTTLLISHNALTALNHLPAKIKTLDIRYNRFSVLPNVKESVYAIPKGEWKVTKRLTKADMIKTQQPNKKGIRRSL